MAAIFSRRAACLGSLAALAGRDAFAAPRPAPKTPAPAADPTAGLADLERRHGGQLGVAVLDLASGDRLAHRADDRFALCSTFKLLAAAHVLARVDRGDETLDRRIQYNASDVVSFSPATAPKADREGLTLGEICAAAVTLSDNTAGNLMLGGLGGPAGLTAYLRTLGDDFTRLDRLETDLNENRPGDPRDTTTPNAMLATLRRILLGDALSAPSRERLTRWLLDSKTGDKRLRAGLPKTWRTASKTGTGENGAANDAGVTWPPGRAPILIAAYYSGAKASPEARNAVLADVGRIAATAFVAK